MPEVLVIDSDGKKLGVLATYEALRLAQEQGLNLVEVAPNSRPPVCRILDYGKYKYDQKQEAKRRKKNQVVVELKEVKFRPKVEKHDFDFKIRHVLRFLEAGDKVKATIMFRGREMAHPELGEQLLRRVLSELEGKVNVELQPRLEGRNMSMVIAPKPGAFPKKEKPEVLKGKGREAGESSSPPTSAAPADVAGAERTSGSPEGEPAEPAPRETKGSTETAASP